MAVNKRFFMDLLKDRQLSLREVARQMDTWPAALSRSFDGKRRMQLPEAVKLAKILSVPLADVMVNAGIQEARTSGRRCNIIGHLTETGVVVPVQAGEIERVSIPDGVTDNVQAIQAHTSDTQAAFSDGWVYFIGEKTDPSTALGMFSLCELEDGSWMLGTVRRGYSIGTYNVFSPFMTSQKSVRITWCRRVLITTH